MRNKTDIRTGVVGIVTAADGHLRMLLGKLIKALHQFVTSPFESVMSLMYPMSFEEFSL